MAITHIFKSGTKELKSVYVPKEIMVKIIAVAQGGKDEEKEESEK